MKLSGSVSLLSLKRVRDLNGLIIFTFVTQGRKISPACEHHKDKRGDNDIKIL